MDPKTLEKILGGARRKFDALAKVDGDHAEIMIYSVIGTSIWGDTVDPKNFVEELADLDVKTISLRINSPGGSVTDGWAIANAVKRHPADVTAYVDGMCGSIATIIALAADRVVMARNSTFMIHNPSGLTWGDAAMHRQTADTLEGMQTQIVATYLAKSTKTEAEIRDAMNAEKWMTPDEALAWGFCDTISDEDVDVAATAQFDVRFLATFEHPPSELVEQLTGEKPAPGTAPAAVDTDETDRPGMVPANKIEQVDERVLDVLLG